MLNRRDLLLNGSAAALLPVVAAFGEPAKPSSAVEAKAMNALFDTFVQEQLQRSPETATSLGLDKDELAELKSRLSDVSLAATAKEKIDNARRIERLKAIDRAALSGLDAANYDTVMFTLAVEDEGDRGFNYGGGGSGAPYILSQLTGSYQSIPDFLDTEHAIESAADAESYMARLNAFATMMDQELEQVRHDVENGVVPPDFVIDKTLVQMNAFLDTPADKATIVKSIGRRAREKGLSGDYEAKAAAIYTGKVLPALARQAAYLKELRPMAGHDAGVARLPKGSDYYRVSLKKYTTSGLSPDEIHQAGLDLVESLSAELDPLLKAQGLNDKSVGTRLSIMASDPKYLYENTDAAKVKMIADLNAKVAVVLAKLPGYFDILPKSKVEIRRVPKNIEAGAPGGYYQPGSLDGARPGAYYINLRDTAELPSWGLSTLTYHESIPGHHLQISLSNETTGLPLIRKILFFSGYGEGWALYAEQLAIEMGMYDSDPLGRIGQLQAALFRAVRLVVDSGMHAKGWSREKTVAYYVDTLGEKETAAVTEIERYCVWPGQACSYMLGKLTWLKARDRARQALGPKFDLRAFHHAGLLSGALPLAVLDQVIDQYVERAK
ncbi:MAG: hypothetical protein JWM91_35 [Rhodospirillales bacterium]|nr:hypothetical protein [Rhodospirillales bacterium]